MKVNFATICGDVNIDNAEKVIVDYEDRSVIIVFRPKSSFGSIVVEGTYYLGEDFFSCTIRSDSGDAIMGFDELSLGKDKRFVTFDESRKYVPGDGIVEGIGIKEVGLDSKETENFIPHKNSPMGRLNQTLKDKR